jgi:hypothetical protein
MAAKQASSKRGLWFKLGRFITGLTIACFFLPFFGVSCEGMDVITVSGADMVAGCKPGGLMAEAADEGGRAGGDDDDGPSAKMNIPKVPVEPLAIVALALAAGAFGLSWLKTRKAMTGVAVCSVACLGALIGLWLKVGGDMKEQVVGEMAKKNSGGEMGRKVMSETKIDAGSRFGLYLACAGLIGAAALCTLALKEPEGTELQPPPPPA